MLYLAIVFSLPIYTFAIFGLYYPQDMILFMDRWRYSEEPEFSDLQMTLFKWGNIAAIVIVTIFLIFSGIITFMPD
ncbi:hypothetical protein LG296_09445 [Ureibacillus chungkukjangi]|uniref:Uncharacterized protein n=1 Tax=Ureibacillus chungkukjangi TaxID=1202712 RepID=A0A318TUV6_9BACL|nr:hypothetical protein BJ095_11653 [Ureibacillus chungkukjangi]